MGARCRTARPETTQHAANAIIPVVSLAAVQLGFMFGGSVVVDTIFALHGAGYLAWESIARNDLLTMQALIPDLRDVLYHLHPPGRCLERMTRSPLEDCLT
jgi:hypothetical protein